ncbi:Protein Skeletor, isoforms D/E [Holothuria leucospilota]|uniref:Protein Skeletor, isoforms D/E n=1 Tax=Holothuria leucospilota TaxID=206669 RepID=A0A9Q1BGW3_HOLLE|nr:Protein Skeletor, isoforms D/E [Holothuria leucospilota]
MRLCIDLFPFKLVFLFPVSDAHFWTGNGLPDPNDRRIPHPPDSTAILPRYNGQDVTVTFPDDLTVNDVDFIGLWCVRARQNFGHLPIVSRDVENIPPYVPVTSGPTTAPTPETIENCQVLLEDSFHISWLVDEGNNKITLTFRGLVEEGEYMAFGRSGQDSFTSMIGSDVTVVWMDPNTRKAQAQDYYLNDYSQCTPDDGRGACPDVLQANGVDDVTLKNAEVRNGVTIITVERPLITGDPRDRDIPPTGDFAVSWGIGFINPTGHVAKHHTRATGTVTVNFGSPSNCPVLTGPTVDPESVNPWTIEPLYPSEDKPMVAVIGPAGGQRGYQGIAGQVGWGLAWYINGNLIPEIHVERGKTYTFYIYGGNDASFLGTYHPFYISDSKDGGYDQKTERDQRLEAIYAFPEEGPLCEYNGAEDPEDYDNFDDYFRTLTLTCVDEDKPGVLRWTVAEDTPDLVYYQCYQHRFFGWKIHVSEATRIASYSSLCLAIVSVLSTSILWL